MRMLFRVFALILLSLTFLSLNPAMAVAEDTDGESFVSRQIEKALSDTNRIATVTGFSGLLTGKAAMQSLTFADENGIWMRLEDVTLDWQRSALFSGELRVAELSAGLLQIIRQPLETDSLADDIPSASASGFKIPELPVLVDIDKIGIDRVEIGQALLGMDAVLSVDGRITLASGEADTELSIRRIDGPRGVFGLTAKHDKETDIFILDLQVREQQDGLISALLDIPDRPQLDLSLTGEGPASDFQAQLRLATERQDRLTGSFTLSAQDDGRQGFDLDLSGDMSSLLAPQFQDFFGDNLSLQAKGSKTPNGAMTLEQLNLDAQSITLSGEGLIDEDGAPVRMNLSGQISDREGDRVTIPSSSEASMQSAVLDLNFDAELSEDWDLTIHVVEPKFGDTELERALLTGGGTISKANQGTQVLAHLEHNISGLDTGDPSLNAALGSNISGVLNASWSKEDAFQLSSLAIDGTDYDIDFQGSLDVVDGTALMEGDLSIDAEDLARFSLLTGQDLTGQARIDLVGSGDLLGGGYDARLELDGQDVSIGIAEVDALLEGQPILLVTEIKRDETGTELKEFSLSSTAVSGTGGGKIGEIGAELDLAFDLTDLGLILPDHPGPVSLKGHVLELAEEWYIVDLSFNGPYDVDASLKGDIGELADALVDLDISIPDMAPITEKINGAEHVTGPVHISGIALNPDDDLWTMELSGDLPFDTAIHLEGAIEDDTALMDYSLSLPDLGQAIPQLADMLSGALTTKGQLQKTGSTWLIETDLDAPHQIEANATTRLSETQVEVDYTALIPELSDFVDTLDGNARVSGKLMQTDGGPWEVLAAGNGPWNSRFDATALLDGDQTNAKVTAHLPDISVLSSSLSGSLDISTQADSAGDGYDILTSARSSSGLTGQAEGRYQTGASQVSFSANTGDVSQFASDISGSVAIQGQVQETPQGWEIDLGTQGPGTSASSVSGTANQSFDALSLSLNGSAPLALANTAISPRALDGQINFDLSLEGPPALSSVSGAITVDNAQLTDPVLRQTFRDISARVDLAGEAAQIDATIAGGQGGAIHIDGPITLSEQLNADITIRLDDVVVEDPTLYTTLLDGRLTISGPLAESGLVTGKIDVGRTEVQVPSGGLGFGSSIPEMTHLNEPNATYQTRVRAKAVSKEASDGSGEGSTGSSSGGIYTLDITVDAPNQIYLRGRGLDIEMGGNMEISGTTDDPLAIGGIRVVRGQLSILGKQLSFSDDSQITLSGELTPYLDLTATSDTGDYTIFIAITGSVDDPEFNFSSEPELPQDEVLSQFLFGSNVSDLTPLQAIQLAASIADLAGYGTSGIGKFRNAIGLDTLNISTNADGTTDVTAGKYLTEQIYTDVVSSSDGDSKVRLNIDLSDNVTVSGSAGNDGETSIGIFFEKDY